MWEVPDRERDSRSVIRISAGASGEWRKARWWSRRQSEQASLLMLMEQVQFPGLMGAELAGLEMLEVGQPLLLASVEAARSCS